MLAKAVARARRMPEPAPELRRRICSCHGLRTA